MIPINEINFVPVYVHSFILPYKTIYWRGVYFGEWRFIRLFVNIKSANINVTTSTRDFILLINTALAIRHNKVRQMLLSGQIAKYFSRQ